MTNSENRFDVIYELQIEKGINAFKVAEGICLEQTVEVDRALACSPFLADSIVGQIVELEPLDMGKYRLQVSYSWDITSNNIPQFMNVLYGNISMKPNIKVMDFIGDHPMFPGPSYGISGLRKMFREPVQPLLCSAIKPLGTDVQTFADMAYDMALGGIHIVKDDHGLNNQSFCPFEERVQKVSEAVQKANSETGGNCMYMPNFGPPIEDYEYHLDVLKKNKIKGILVSPFLVGLDRLRFLAEHEDFVIMAHPSFSGGYQMHATHGFRSGFLLGKLFRLLGADASIYCNIGGRFSFDLATCRDINEELRSTHARIRTAFPVPAGGMTLSNIGQMKQFYGKDLIFLVGGALLQSDDLTQGAQEFRRIAFSD